MIGLFPNHIVGMRSLTAFVLVYTLVLYSTVESQHGEELSFKITRIISKLFIVTAEVDPNQSNLRSAPGYNNIILTCIVNVTGIQYLHLDWKWKINSQDITNNSDSVIIDSITYCYKECKSHLKQIFREPGSFTVTCSVAWDQGTVKADAIVNVGGKKYERGYLYGTVLSYFSAINTEF